MIQYHSENYGKIIKPLGIVFTMVRGTRMMSEVISGPGETSAGARYIFENYEKFYVLCGGPERHIPFQALRCHLLRTCQRQRKHHQGIAAII